MEFDPDTFDIEKFRIQFGKRVRKLRESNGYSQNRLADEAGISHATMPKIEAGRVDPKASTLFKIAAILDIPVGKLFGSGK